MTETTRDVEATDALDRLETTAISADYADERQVQKDVTTIEVEIRRLRSEVEEVHARSQRWQSRFHERLAELERRDAALRELADEWEEDAADLLSVPPCGAVEIAIAGTMQACANDLRALATLTSDE